MDNVVEQADWEVECNRMLEERLGGAGGARAKISDDYTMNLVAVLFGLRDLLKELPEEYRDRVTEFDSNWNDILMEASREYYKLGFADAMQGIKSSPDP
ncbi:MAG: hypothetical protein ACYCVB_16825 [Bacilli bacterium]